MIIVNVQDHADAIQQKTADFQQITKGDVLIHHTDHLPSVRMSSGSRNKPARRPAEMATADSPKDSEPPTVSGMPANASIPYFDKNVKWNNRIFRQKALDKCGILAYNKDKERAYQ